MTEQRYRRRGRRHHWPDVRFRLCAGLAAREPPGVARHPRLPAAARTRGQHPIGHVGWRSFGTALRVAGQPCQGHLAGGAAVAAAIFGVTLLHIGPGAAPTLIGLIFAVPMAWVSVLGMAVVRWLVDRQVEARRESAPLLRRLRLPLILAGALGLVAIFALRSADARLELRRMNDMVLAGLHARNAASLPAPLQAPSVVGFPIGTRSGYTLEWTNVDLDRFIELRPAANYDQQAAVIARFKNGPSLACIYTAPKAEPSCGTY